MRLRVQFNGLGHRWGRSRLSPRLGGVVLLASTLLVLAAAPLPSGQRSATGSRQEPRRVEVRGRVVCLPEEMHRRFHTDLPARHRHVYGVTTPEGTCYTLLETGLSVALFQDERLREKQLLLAGRVLPGTQILDVEHIHSIRNGVVQELFYYCRVCEIRSISPEPCMCCRQPVELIEKPLAETAKRVSH